MGDFGRSHVAPPGILPPSTPAMRNGSRVGQSVLSASVVSGGSAGAGSGIGSQIHAEARSGTDITANGLVTINIIVDDMERTFQALRDTERFLSSLFPGWTLPLFHNGVGLPNEVGASYTMEHMEKKEIDNYDGASKRVEVRRKKRIAIKSIADQELFKTIEFDVTSTMHSEYFQEPFPAQKFLIAEIKQFAYERDRWQLTISFDGGPQDVEASYCCFCIANASSTKLQEEAGELRPKIFKQAASVIKYFKEYSEEATPSRNPVRQMEENSYAGTNSKLSKGSKGQKRYLAVRQGSRGPSTGAWSTGSGPSAADEIKKLYELMQMGAISKQDFESQKAKLLQRHGSIVDDYEPNIF